MILNKTTDKQFNIKIKYANNFFKRFKGLMGKKEIDFALVFTNLKDSSIHTHFMRTEIDVYFLDENKIVFEKTSLKPWKFHRPKKQAKYILETKKDELKIKIGDELDFI
jgi:uncharacterized membrane protein (UPF0127 family)